MSEFQGNEPRPPAPGPDDLASFSAYAKRFARVNGVALPESEFRQGWDSTPDGKVGKRRIPPGAAGIKVGMKKYANIPVPALAIFAVPHDLGAWVKASSDPTVQEAARTFTALETPLTERQAKAFEEGVPNAHVVRLAGASHFIFLSNQADVLREMHAFVMAIAPR